MDLRILFLPNVLRRNWWVSMKFSCDLILTRSRLGLWHVFIGQFITSGKVKGGERRGLGPVFHMPCLRHDGALPPIAIRLWAPLPLPYLITELWPLFDVRVLSLLNIILVIALDCYQYFVYSQYLEKHEFSIVLQGQCWKCQKVALEPSYVLAISCSMGARLTKDWCITSDPKVLNTLWYPFFAI